MTYVLMQVVTQKVSAVSPSVSVIDRKERAGWPVVGLLEDGLSDVKNNRHSVLIVVPGKTQEML